MLENIPYQNGQLGAIRDPRDDRDLIYDDYVLGAAPVEIDWEKGFDIRDTLGGDFTFKNQGVSMSCVSQGVSYYVWVKQVIEMMAKYGLKLPELREKYPQDVDEVSAKAIYAQIFIEPQGGAYIRSGMKIIVDWGSVFEHDIPSVNPKTGFEDEEWMRDRTWLNAKISEIAKILKGKKFMTIAAADNMDLFARAIMENNGVVGGVLGQNEKGWSTENPEPPDSANNTWGHCLFYGAFGTDEKGKFIATPNSWGNGFRPDPTYVWKPGDKPGRGWQKLRANYFNNTYQFNPWTYTDLRNKDNDMTFKKELNKPAIYLINEEKKTKTMIVDMPTMDVLGGQFEEVSSLAEYTDKGTLVWNERIIN